jgi:Spy/CpxP family protein refolding chaperone
MKKLTLTLITVAIGLLLTMPAFAFGPGSGYGPGRGYGEGRGFGYHNEAGLWRINLTDEQKTKIEALKIAQQKEMRPIREKMFDKSVELRRLWLQVNPDKDKILNLQKEVRALRDQLEDKATAQNLEIRKLLTPEQQEKLANSGWGRGMGFGPRGGIRGFEERGPGICY